MVKNNISSGNNMLQIFATLIIVIAYNTFFYVFANIFLPLLFDIPATIKLARKNLINARPVLIKYILIVLINLTIALAILTISYFLFIKYSFGFSLSIFIGATLALLISLWKASTILSTSSANYITWLEFYMQDNSRYFETSDTEIIHEALDGKPVGLEK